MMKKDYMKPNMTVVELKYEFQLLTVSEPQGGEGDSRYFDLDDEY